MNAISGTRRQLREMADGTIRVQIDIDPSCRAAFLQLFPNIDMPVALAPLVANFEQSSGVVAQDQAETSDKPKGGPLARLAGQMCQNPEFLKYLGDLTPEDAAEHIRFVCDVESRAELDHNQNAAQRFHDEIRKPFVVWKEGR